MLSVGDSFTAETQVIPSFKQTPSYSLTSQNSRIVSVDGEAIFANANGATTVDMSAMNGKFSDSFEVTVKDISYAGLASTRTATGIVLARVPTSIEVGEEYSCQAYVLSAVTADHPCKYRYEDDNLVYFTSSNPNVVRVKNGVLTGLAIGSATITAHAVDSAIVETFTVTVTEPETLVYTSAEVYEVPSIDTTDEESTTTGIAAALLYASENNYKKVVFPTGVYYVSPVYGTIEIPTRMIVDFNNSIIQIGESAMTATGYRMFMFHDTEYSKLINVTIYGERYLISGTGAESCVSVRFDGNNYKSGIEDCTISNSPGFNVTCGFANRKIVGVPYAKIEAGGINANGEPVEAEYSYRSGDFVSISSLGSWFGLGNMQGYQGYLYMSARVYDIFFYDTNKQFISKLENCIQYYHYPKPINAKYTKIQYYWGTAPTGGDPDYHAIAHLYTLDTPVNCYVRNCTFENCYSTGLVPNAGDNFLIENVLFRDNGVRDPASQIDWEDGRNNIKGHIVRNCRFIRGGPVMFVGGDGITVHNNAFSECYLDHRGEVQNSRIFLNQFIGNRKSTIQTKTDMVFSQNFGANGATYQVTNGSNVSFAVREADNVFE